MPNKRKPGKRSVATWVDQGKAAELDCIAQASDRKMAYIVEQALDEYLASRAAMGYWKDGRYVRLEPGRPEVCPAVGQGCVDCFYGMACEAMTRVEGENDGD